MSNKTGSKLTSNYMRHVSYKPMYPVEDWPLGSSRMWPKISPDRLKEA